jgi:hypothetical protein
MIKIIFLRVLPMVAAVGIVGGALSPVNGTIEAFGAAADALAGKTDIHTEGISVNESMLPTEITGIDKPKKSASSKKKSLQALADKMDKNGTPTDPDDFGHEAGDRAMKPLELPPPPKKKK